MNEFRYTMNPVTDEVIFARDLEDGMIAVVQDAGIPEGRTGQMYRISGIHPHDGYLHWVGIYEDGFQYGSVPFIVRKS